MNIPAPLKKEIAGVPAWIWGATLVAFIGIVIWRRRQAAAAAAADDVPIEDGYLGGPTPSWPGGMVGGGEEGGFVDDSTGVIDALQNLADQLGDRFDALESGLEAGFEQTVAAINEGFTTEEPPEIPDEDGDQGGNEGGNGNGQLPDPKIDKLRDRRAAIQARIDELRRGAETKAERERIAKLRDRKRSIQDRIDDLKNGGGAARVAPLVSRPSLMPAGGKRPRPMGTTYPGTTAPGSRGGSHSSISRTPAPAPRGPHGPIVLPTGGRRR